MTNMAILKWSTSYQPARLQIDQALNDLESEQSDQHHLAVANALLAFSDLYGTHLMNIRGLSPKALDATLHLQSGVEVKINIKGRPPKPPPPLLMKALPVATNKQPSLMSSPANKLTALLRTPHVLS